MRIVRLALPIWLISILLGSLGCGSGSGCIKMMIATPQVTIARGTQGTVAVTFADSNGFVDSVVITDAPGGILSLFDPPPGTGPTTIVTSGTLRIMVPASTVPGTYLVTVEARQYTNGAACVSTVSLSIIVI